MNRAHKRTRSIVERGIGQLKRRFHVLHGEVRLSPQKTCQVGIACAVLYNICKDRQIPNPDGDPESDNENDNDGDAFPNLPQAPAAQGNNGSTLYRQQFATTHDNTYIGNEF